MKSIINHVSLIALIGMLLLQTWQHNLEFLKGAGFFFFIMLVGVIANNVFKEED